jgi:acyl carrier protein
MTANAIRDKVLLRLSEIAPEADLSAVDPDVNLREQLDIDSMDALNFMIALHKEFGVDIPERDYARLATINQCVGYLERAQQTLHGE